MLQELYDLGYFNYQSFISDFTTELGLSPNESFVLIKILDNYKESKKINLKKLQQQTNLSKNDLQDTLAVLMDRSFYEIIISYNEKGVGEEYISLSSFFEKVEKILNHENENVIPNKELEIKKIVEFLEVEMKRFPTPSEIEMLNSLVDDGYGYDMLVQAVQLCKKKRRLINLRNITMMIGCIENPNVIKKTEEKNEQQAKVISDFFDRL